MTHARSSTRSALLGAASLSLTVALAACGGGGSAETPSTAAAPPAPAPAAAPAAPAPLTTNVSTTVIDGPIRNAIVCLDKNGNGQCDADEIKGTTDASGNVTLAVPNADVGKYPLLAVIGKDAVDADHGPVPVAYTMSAPADQAGVVSPLTTLVQQTVASTGASTSDAARSVQSATNLSVSVFHDYTKDAAPTDGSVGAATVARMLVVTAQQQASAVASAVGSRSMDGSAITQADLDKAVQRQLLDLLPALVTALSDPAVQSAATASAKESALLAAATAIVGASGLSATSAPTVVAVNKAIDAPATTGATTFSANVTLVDLNYTGAESYFAHTITQSTAQATPDAGGLIRYVNRRLSKSGGGLAKWGIGAYPARNSNLHWNDAAWVGCPINFESTARVRDAQGNGASNACDGLSFDTSKRATFDIAGRSMADVYAQARAAGYTNLAISDPATLGQATFPAGAAVFYQSNSEYQTAIVYYAAGAQSPAGLSNVSSQYSAAVADGGIAGAQAGGAGCNSAEANGGAGIVATQLETWMAAKHGTPCVYAQGSLTYNGSTYLSDTTNEWWGNSTATIDKIGNAPLTPTSTTTGFYTGNTLLRLAFSGTGVNPVTYYACKERLYTGSTRNCQTIGEGSYTITSLGDARVLQLTNPPPQVAALAYDKLWVERGGFVRVGFRNKPAIYKTARLNTVAATALLTQLGIPVEDPQVPLALTAPSYQGTWDLRHADSAVSATTGTTLYISTSGTSFCADKSTAQSFACTVTITDPTTGAFTYSDATGTASGSFDFLAGTVTGTYSDSTTTPATGGLAGGRR